MLKSSIAVALLAAGALSLSAQSLRSITSLTANPTLVYTNQPTVVTMVAAVAPNPTLITGSVNLTQVTSDGRLVAVLGPMYDNGTHGDVIAGDGNFTTQIAVNVPAMASVWYRATAAYQGVLTRAQSPLAVVFVTSPGCTYIPDRSAFSFGASGGPGTINIEAPANCPWPASSDSAWLSITSPVPGSGNGFLNFNVAANPTTSARTGTITIANRTIKISQAGVVCTYSLDSPSGALPASGGTGTFHVNAPPPCSWTANSDSPTWLSVLPPGSGTGNGSIGYQAGANPTTPRSGNITVGGKSFLVSQLGGPPPITCSITADSPAVRRSGRSELAGALYIGCANLPSGGIVADIAVTLNTTLASRVTDPVTNLTEALLLLNDPPTPMLGVNAFQGAVQGYATVGFSSVPILPGSAFRLVNLRADSSLIPAPVNAMMATVSFTSASPIDVVGSPVAIALLSPATAVITSTAPISPTMTLLQLTLQESFPTALRVRTGAAATLDPSAEAGYWAPSLPSNMGAADTGTRVRALFQPIAGVNVYAPIYPAGSQDLQLVSADGNGLGGAFLSGSALGGTHALLAPQDGILAATWEVRAAHPAAMDQYVFSIVVENATTADLAGILQSVVLAPVGTGSSAVPRFVDTTLPPPVFPPL